jgi:translation elongation factor EF-Ts
MSDLAACAHTKITEITWRNNSGDTSGKFMCLNCNTDFVPVTREIWEFLNTRPEFKMPNKPENNQFLSRTQQERISESESWKSSL